VSDVPDSVALGIPGVDIASGDHLCAFYHGSPQRNDILYPFLVAGLTAGDKVFCAVDTPEPKDVLHALEADVDLAVCLERRQLHVQRSLETYLPDGGFSAEALIDFWDDTIGGALASGFPFARAVGEMTWAMTQLIGPVQLVGYESALNRFLSRYPQVILCLYDLDGVSGELLVDLLRTHPRVLLGGVVHHNPYYVPPDEFLAFRQ
jgi:hypothetical protein